MPPPGLHVHLAVLDQGRADVDAGVEVAGVGEVAHRATVGRPLDGLELVDDLHRPDLRRARQGAGGERGAQRVHGVRPRHAAVPETEETMCITCE